MRYKLFLLTVLSLLVAVAAQAQNVRLVRGSVVTEAGVPLANAVITAENGEKFHPEKDGSFEIRVSFLCRELTFTAEGYESVTRTIDGMYMLVKMAVDMTAEREAEAQARAEEEARLKAEKEAIAKAMAEEEARLKAEKDAKKAAEAQAKAEEEARIKAEKEAEAKAKAEQQAREKAEKERLAAIEQARRDSIARVVQAQKDAEAQALAQKKAEAKAIRQEKDAAYNEKYRNKGIEHSVDISYSYPIQKCEVYYHYSGRREYGVLHPFELDYTLSYRINRIVSVGAGAGLLFHAKSITIVNDTFSPVYGDFKERRLDVPVFGAVKITPLRKGIRPVIGGSAGYYLLSRTLMWEGDLGAEFRISRRAAAHILLSVRSTPYPYFDEYEGFACYQPAISPAVKIGFSF